MRYVIISALVVVALTGCNRQSTIRMNHETVEASCGQCQFGLEGEGCDLAIRVGRSAWFVDGSHIDAHGDAHAADGLCNAIRPARVTGHVVDGRFRAEVFDVLPR